MKFDQPVGRAHALQGQALPAAVKVPANPFAKYRGATEKRLRLGPHWVQSPQISAAVYLHSRSGDWCAALHSHESWTGQVPKGTWTGQRLLKVIQGLTDSNSLTSKLKLAGWNGEGYEQESKEQNRLFSSVHVAASCSHLPLQMELAYS